MRPALNADKELLAQALREYPTWGDAYLAEKHRAEAAEVELDALHRALDQAREQIDRGWSRHLNEADMSDEDGSHIGLARHHRAVATGLGDALAILNVLTMKAKT